MFEKAIKRVGDTIDGFVRGESDFAKAKQIIPFVYYILFFIAFTHLEGLNQFIAQGGAHFTARTPLFWTSYFEYSSSVTIIYLVWLATALGACIFPYSRSARILAFLGFLEYHALMASFGGPNHQWDHWLWILLILIFLPRRSENPSQETRKTFSLVFWGAQAFLLLTYSMAGAGKIVYGFIQLAQGQASIFSPDAAALFASTQLNLMHETVPLASLIINYPPLAWLPFLLILELQTFAIVVALRPELHRLWGLGLILFHISTYLGMRAVFTAPSALLLLLLVASPFAPAKWFDRNTLFAIPLFGDVARFIHNRQNRTSAE